MIKITPETIDYLMTDDLLCELLDEQHATFQLQFLMFFAVYQKKLDDVLSAAPAQTSEPASESAAKPIADHGLCPVGEHVADLTEQLNDALGRLADLEAVAETQHNIMDMLVTIADNHTSALDSVHNVVGQVLATVQKLPKATK